MQFVAGVCLAFFCAMRPPLADRTKQIRLLQFHEQVQVYWTCFVRKFIRPSAVVNRIKPHSGVCYIFLTKA